MYYVYLLQSISNPDQKYVGYTANLKQRIQTHNSGHSKYTAKYKPWEIVSYHAFAEKSKAQAFEKYLKSGSGQAFANKRLR